MVEFGLVADAVAGVGSAGESKTKRLERWAKGAQLIKIYGPEFAGEARYSPPACIGTKEKHVCGMACGSTHHRLRSTYLILPPRPVKSIVSFSKGGRHDQSHPNSPGHFWGC